MVTVLSAVLAESQTRWTPSPSLVFSARQCRGSLTTPLHFYTTIVLRNSVRALKRPALDTLTLALHRKSVLAESHHTCAVSITILLRSIYCRRFLSIISLARLRQTVQGESHHTSALLA